MSKQDAVSLELAHATLRSSARQKYLAIVEERVAGGGEPDLFVGDVESVVRQVLDEPLNAWAIQYIVAHAQLPPWVKREVIRVETRPAAMCASTAPAESEVARG